MEVDSTQYRIIHTKHEQYLVPRSDQGISIENRLTEVPNDLIGARLFTTTCGKEIITHVLSEESQSTIISKKEYFS